MVDIRKLLQNLTAQEEQLSAAWFLAPCVQSGLVRTKVAGLLYSFLPRPRDFEGWGIFQPVTEKEAEVRKEASLPRISEYLQLFKPLRVRLAHHLQNQTWLVYPVNESDARQRFGEIRPVAVHLVNDGAGFEQAIARWDGSAWWFEEIDRKADPLIAEQLREALRKGMPSELVRFQGVTPEMRTTYDIALQQTKEFKEKLLRKTKEYREKLIKRSEETRLREALRMGGGTLHDFQDRGGFWLVEWITSDGERHSSAIGKKDLTVISSGICLSGRDSDFDLQSLVGVMEGG